MNLPAGTVTFLLTDVVGATPLWEADPVTMAASMERHHDLVRAAVALHGGALSVEQGEGDSVVAAFSSVAAAASAAVDAQHALLGEAWPAGAEIVARMAMHTADAEPTGNGTYQGTGIARCARIRSLGHGGQILLSAVTAELLRERLPPEISLVALGAARLKGLQRLEEVWQLQHPGLPQSFPALFDAGLHRTTSLPTTSFIGRGELLADLEARLAEDRIISLTGIGGCGKTRVADELSRRVAPRFPGGVWWVELASARSADDAISELARAGGVADEPGRALVETVLDRARHAGEQLLVVLDNAEHLLDPMAELVGRLVRASPLVTVLTTSREAIGVPGEVSVRIPSLEPAAALELFVQRADAARPGSVSSAADQKVAEEVCRRLDRLPLAIELAAARVRSAPLSRVATGLDDALRLLAGGPRGSVTRQQTMRACLSWSIDQLSDVERLVLHRLSAFVGSFELDAAEGVCSGDGVEDWEVFDILDRLVGKSLLTPDDASGRYRLLEVVRQHGLEQLAAVGQLSTIRDRHAGWFCAWVQELAPAGSRHDEALQRIAEDHPNLSAALDTGLVTRRADALETLACLSAYFGVAERSTESARRFDELTRDDDGTLAWARALAALGVEALWAGSADLSGLGHAEAVAEEHGDRWAALLARYDRAQVAGFTGDLAPLEAVAVAARREGVVDVELLALFQLATWDLLFGRPQRALEIAEPLVPRMRSTGWELFAVLPYLLTASAMASLGRVTEALDRLALVEPETTVAGVTFAGTYGRVAFVTDDPALLVRARVGLAPSEWGLVASILDRLGCIEAVLARDWLGATTRIDAARERALFPAFAVDLDALLAPCQLTLGDLSSATSTVVRLHESGVALGCPTASVAAAVNAASVGLLGASPAARSLTLDAVRSARAAGLAIELIDALELHAVALAVDGREEDARRFGGAAVAARSSHRYRFRWPHIHDLLSRYIGALGDRDEGLDLDTAAELALRGRGSRRRTGLGWAGLTPTEQKVVELVAQGCSNEDIAAALVMGTATVRTHLNHVYTKLGVSSRTALAAEATRRASALDSTASGDRPR